MTRQTLDERQLDQLLDAIEACEQRALKWGYTGAFLTEHEAQRMALDVTGGDDDAAFDLIEALQTRALLMELRDSGGARVYRSRFAEAVRLMTSLRQLLPWRDSWKVAPRLVSDFRIDRRPRRFPKRDRDGSTAIAALAAEQGWSQLQVDIALKLLESPRGTMDLSGFQERSVREVFGGAGKDAGVIISAGTGSGKTLAYYLPAFVSIGAQVAVGQHWTKSLSIYPRNELLKDQFTQAFQLARRVSPLLPRPLRLATFYGDTPNSASIDSMRGWQAVPGGDGFICPFLTCPECRSRLAWRRSDLQARRERLVCLKENDRNCAFESNPDEIALTRRSLQAHPADALFTTSETLNQRMSDPESQALFGIGRVRKPTLLLLDEVHTYEGISGAHTALMLRRWRNAVGTPILRVGLSATLTEAPSFFAQVAGVRESEVVEVAPRSEEIEYDSAEYQLVLRGDPVSQLALLSTSIQASFLLARILDRERQPKSAGRFGQRVFVFTDDLDVTNRLFDDLRDAEGLGPRPGAPLANMRKEENDPLRFEAGQDWRHIANIGWNLSQSLGVSRTSSRDAGVDRASQIVVATASLEVGFNDDRVGAVLQHKAPYHPSSFVQRKGRAGRTRAMRPWTVTVLSDYGRDRFQYQAYHTLFDAVLPAQRLPVENEYVQRIHAGFATIEWLAARHSRLRGWWWWAANGPSDNNFTRTQQTEAQGGIL